MNDVRVNDEVQWTINGADQFPVPKKVKMVSECGGFCFVEGSNTGLPTDQITVMKRTTFHKSEDGECDLTIVSEVIKAKDPTKRLVIPTEEKFTFFWRGVFSQWHRCRFHVDGIWYNCAEQYMMAQKAIHFGDVKTAKKVMEASDPSVQKKLGREVKPYDEDKWNAVAKEVVYKGNLAKFTQNKMLLKKLMETEGTTLVEASPYDNKWGIGMGEKDPRCQRRETWRGTNWLGEVLTQLREDLKRELAT